MSEELENSVQGMLQEEKWTRTALSSFTENNMKELEELLERARSEGVEDKIKEICDKQLENSKDSIIALYLSGMISLRNRSLDTSSLETLTDIFQKTHKETLVEKLLLSILDIDKENKFALKTLAKFYKENNDDRLWEIYERIVRVDFEEADIAKILADRYEEQGNKEKAVSYYKKALSRYISAKNAASTHAVWSILVRIIPDDINYFLREQKKIAKLISEDKSALLMQEVYEYYKTKEKKDTAIKILKLILEIDNKDVWARKEIVECYRAKYAENPRLEDYIRASNLTQSFRNVFEAISDFEKHIAFSKGSYVYHRTWGVGYIGKVEGDTLKIKFMDKQIRSISLKMAVASLQPLSKHHIWVKKATMSRQALTEMVKGTNKENQEAAITATLKRIIESFGNNCDDKKIKAELVPSILSAGEWTSWHAKAQKIMETNKFFDVNPNDNSCHTYRESEITTEERLANEFKAEKNFFARLDILMRYFNDDNLETNDELFTEMFTYFANYLKAFNNVNEQIVASYLAVQKINKKIPSYVNPAQFTFQQLFNEIEKPQELYASLKDTKNTSLKEDFIANVRLLPDWDDQYIKIFPAVLKKSMLNELNENGKKDKIVRLIQTSFEDYRNYRNAVVFFYKDCRNEEWFKEAAISFEKQLVTLVNVIAICNREIDNHFNTTENKKTIKSAQIIFAEKQGDEVKNTYLDYMTENGIETINRMYTIVNDVRGLEPKIKSDLRIGILKKFPDYKFDETEVKQEAPKGLLVTSKMKKAKEAEAQDIENVQIPQNNEEVSEARAKGDLSENAEYETAKAKQRQLQSTLAKLKAELASCIEFDKTTIATSIVSFGTTVKLHDNVNNSDIQYTILGPWESDPDQGIISYMSPLGHRLLNLKVGEVLEFQSPDGRDWNMTVLSIEAAKELD